MINCFWNALRTMCLQLNDFEDVRVFKCPYRLGDWSLQLRMKISLQYVEIA